MAVFSFKNRIADPKQRALLRVINNYSFIIIFLFMRRYRNELRELGVQILVVDGDVRPEIATERNLKPTITEYNKRYSTMKNDLSNINEKGNEQIYLSIATANIFTYRID